MPTLSSLEIPRPRNWQDFESISLSSFKIRWKNPNLVKNGRNGQAQAGIDIYGEDHLGQFVGVQCKDAPEVKLSVIEEELAKAEKFVPPLNIFYLSTTAETDAAVQSEVRLLSIKRVKEGKFAVGIFFWDEVITELCKNKVEFALHYPEFKFLTAIPAIGGARRSSILDLAFYGPEVDAYMDLLFGEDSAFSNANPYDMQRLLLSVETACAILFDVNRSGKLIADANVIWEFIEAYVIDGQPKVRGWSEINNSVQRLGNSILASENLFIGQELAIFKLGRILGAWEIKATDGYIFSLNDTERIRELFGNLSPNSADFAAFEAELRKYFADPESISNAQRPFAIYNIVRRRLTRAEIVMEPLNRDQSIRMWFANRLIAIARCISP